MGCGCAKIGKSKNVENEVEEVVNNSRRIHKVSVHVAPDIQKIGESADKPLIVFVFGGPGSFKGRVVDDLIQAYGFTYLNAEDVILDQLPKRLHLASHMDKIMDLLQFLNDDDSCLTLEWLFEILMYRIARRPQASYLIDIVTNLRVLLRAESLNVGHQSCLKMFEEKFPVMFAINLAIPKDKILRNVASHYAQNLGRPMTADEIHKETLRHSDEVDLSKTQKRANLYLSNAKPYLDYFTDRLISVDVSCAMPDSISFKICDICRDQGIPPVTSPKSSLLFSFVENSYPGLDVHVYGLEKIVLANVVPNVNSGMDETLSVLCEEVKRRLCTCRHLYIDLHGTSLTKQSLENVSSKGVSFVEVLEGPLDHFMPVDARTDANKLYTADNFKAIVSPEGDTCIFQCGVSTNVCVRLARVISDSRSSRKNNRNGAPRVVKSSEMSIEVLPFNPVDS